MLGEVLGAVDRDVGRTLQDQPLHVDDEGTLTDQAREFGSRLAVASRLDGHEFAIDADARKSLLHEARLDQRQR